MEELWAKTNKINNEHVLISTAMIQHYERTF